MAFENNDRFQGHAASMEQAGVKSHEIDQGLRSYMLRVYNYMASGLCLTGIVAMGTAMSPDMMQMIYGTPLKWVVMFAPFGFILALNFGLHKMSATALQGVFWAFAAVMGLSLAYIFAVYTGASIARVFFITAGTFGAMSLWGYTTKRDLSGMGSFLMMGLIGIFIAFIVNIFLQSEMIHYVASAIGVLVFVGLTAYDTQKIKSIYSETDSREIQTKKVVLGATTLYLDFINLFVMLLQFFGNRE